MSKLDLLEQPSRLRVPVAWREPTLLLAWCCIALAIGLNRGNLSPPALLLVTVGVAAIGAVAVWGGRSAAQALAQSPTLPYVAPIGIVIGASLLWSVGQGPYQQPALTVAKVLLATAGVASVATVTHGHGRGRARGPAVMAAVTFLAASGMVAVIAASPHPTVDVWAAVQGSARSLAHGSNFYAQELVGSPVNQLQRGFPYLPGTVLALFPFWWVLGDVRYGLVAALVASAVVVYRLAGTERGPALAALLILFPLVSFSVQMSWTDPLILLGLAGMVLAVRRGRPGLAVLCFAFALSSKQYALLFLPLAGWWPSFGWRRTAWAGTIAAAVTLPWVLSDLQAFLDGAVRYNLDQVPRGDALSLSGLAAGHGLVVPMVVVVGTVAAALVLPRRRFQPTASWFVLGAALVQASFNLVNKVSFLNQWSLVLGLVILALAVRADELRSRDEDLPVVMARPETFAALGAR